MINFVFYKGRLKVKYPKQSFPQPVCFDIHNDGKVYIFSDPEIGNAVPQDVFSGVVRRYYLPFYTKEKVRNFLSPRKHLLQVISNGISPSGKLSPEAQEAEEQLEKDLFYVKESL